MVENFGDCPGRGGFAACPERWRKLRRQNPQAAQPAAGAPHAAMTAEASSSARFFTPAQHAMIEELSETIIPADSHSGGAKAAKVADYIEQRIRESVDEQQKALWREGLRLMESMSQHYNGKSIVDSSTEEKIAILKVLSDNAQLTELPEVQFFPRAKKFDGPRLLHQQNRDSRRSRIQGQSHSDGVRRLRRSHPADDVAAKQCSSMPALAKLACTAG